MAEKGDKKALEYFSKAEELNSNLAMYYKGLAYYKGVDSMPPIPKYTKEEITLIAFNMVKEKGYDMTEYMARINANHMAKMVKLADRVHNLAEAKFASEKFQRKYVKETDDYFIDLAKGTVFEADLKKVLEEVRSSLEDSCL